MQPPRLDTSLAFRIHRASRLLRQHFLSLASEAGVELTPEQFFVLNKLRRRDGRSQVELADPALGDRPNVTRIVALLQRRELVERRADPQDGRIRRVFLTEAGAALHDRFVEVAVLPARGDLFGELDSEQNLLLHWFFDDLEARLRAR